MPYEVYDFRSGALIAAGTAAQCAEQLGISDTGFRSAIKRCKRGQTKKYRIVKVDSLQPEQLISEQDRVLRAIEAWDAFTEPLRKKFGIPVHKEKRK